jgi:hypothetical protein
MVEAGGGILGIAMWASLRRGYEEGFETFDGELDPAKLVPRDYLVPRRPSAPRPDRVRHEVRLAPLHPCRFLETGLPSRAGGPTSALFVPNWSLRVTQRGFPVARDRAV